MEGKRTKLYLSSEKACKIFGKLLLEESYCVHIGKEQRPGRTKSVYYVEYWKE